MHTAKCKFNTNVLSLPPVTVVRNRLCFKGFGGGGGGGEISSQVGPGYGHAVSGLMHIQGQAHACTLHQALGLHGPAGLHGVTACLGLFVALAPAQQLRGWGQVFPQFRESLSCQRNHVATIQQMNSNNATVLGWPYLHWASQECQDFSIHKKCTSGTSCLCHFSCTPQSQMIHIVRGDSVFGLICASPLCRFWEQGNAPSPDIFLHRSVAAFL